MRFGKDRDICRDDTGLLSAFVDGAVDAHTREQVATHLLHCAACRDEVASLRQLRALLADCGTTPTADDPPPINDRLVQIAGAASSQPLWARPFSAESGDVGLPSARRASRRKMAGSVTGVIVAVTMVLAAGWFAAPPPDTAIINPVADARAGFVRSTAQLPTTLHATIAVVAASPAAVKRLTEPGDPVALVVRKGPALSADQARGLIKRAGTVTGSTRYRGWAEVAVSVGDGKQLLANVETVSSPGLGAEITVVDMDGAVVRTTNVPTPSPTSATLRLPDGLTGVRQQEIAGHAATVVEASAGDVVRARWWFDDHTGLLLRAEAYQDGRLVSATQYTTVEIGEADFVAHPAPRLYRPSSTAQLQLSQASEMNSRGWSCHSELAGLPLSELGSRAGSRVETTYSDGVATVTVSQDRGTILTAPPGFAWDETVGAYRNRATPAMAIWQSRDVVFTVTTDGGASTIEAAVAELPHDAPVLRTRWGRLTAGWNHIWKVVTGG